MPIMLVLCGLTRCCICCILQAEELIEDKNSKAGAAVAHTVSPPGDALL